MSKKILVVKTVDNSHHIIDFSLIESVCPKDSRDNKSTISLIGSDQVFYSTETPIQIFEKIKVLQSE